MRLYDSFGRRFSYLRLSIIDACNFRCVYCLPQGFQKPQGVQESYLSLSEIRNLALAFTEMGMWKVRLTGGEPTLRRDLTEIIRMLKAIPGIKKIALSTNGYRLKYSAQELFLAGLQAVNVSVDSLDHEKFKTITGQDVLKEILEGIDCAIEVGISKIKVNVVLLGGWNEIEFVSFMQWIRTRKITVRFIELMPTGQNATLFQKHHLTSQGLWKKMLEYGWQPVARDEAEGPAVEFSHPDYLGKMGVIAPYTEGFCATCNRLRVTCYGGLRLCLFGEGNYSLREFLQKESQKQELKAFICSLLQKKEVSHYLPQGLYGNNHSFSSMGG